MPGYERRVDRDRRRLREQLTALGRDIREARLAAGLSQRAVAFAARVSQPYLSRIERGLEASPSLETLTRIAGLVGLELALRGFPAGSPLRDAAHLGLIDRLRAVASSIFRWRSEVPLPILGDRRAWDAGAFTATGDLLFVIEAETRLRDVQALCRRLALKKRDGGVERLLLVLADTRSNRSLVRAAGTYLTDLFPVTSSDALADLRAGRVPNADALVFI